MLQFNNLTDYSTKELMDFIEFDPNYLFRVKCVKELCKKGKPNKTIIKFFEYLAVSDEHSEIRMISIEFLLINKGFVKKIDNLINFFLDKDSEIVRMLFLRKINLLKGVDALIKNRFHRMIFTNFDLIKSNFLKYISEKNYHYGGIFLGKCIYGHGIYMGDLQHINLNNFPANNILNLKQFRALGKMRIGGNEYIPINKVRINQNLYEYKILLLQKFFFVISILQECFNDLNEEELIIEDCEGDFLLLKIEKLNIYALFRTDQQYFCCTSIQRPSISFY